MQSVKNILDTLYRLQYSLTQTHFRELFGEAAAHLWNKYSTAFNYNLVEFYANLDPDKKMILCNYISTYNPPL